MRNDLCLKNIDKYFMMMAFISISSGVRTDVSTAVISTDVSTAPVESMDVSTAPVSTDIDTVVMTELIAEEEKVVEEIVIPEVKNKKVKNNAGEAVPVSDPVPVPTVPIEGSVGAENKPYSVRIISNIFI
jgi:hypothetical protein